MTRMPYLAAADLIEATGWTQGAGARNAEGVHVNTISEEATCFCAIGALYRLTNGNLSHYDDDLVAFNDTPGRTKEEVVALLRELGA